jgi:threonine/homoserine/homoserine lactone efflux protein
MMLQFILLGLLFIAATIVVFGSIAMLAGSLGEWMGKSPRVQSIMNKVASLVLFGLALKIATAHR